MASASALPKIGNMLLVEALPLLLEVQPGFSGLKLLLVLSDMFCKYSEKDEKTPHHDRTIWRINAEDKIKDILVQSTIDFWLCPSLPTSFFKAFLIKINLKIWLQWGSQISVVKNVSSLIVLYQCCTLRLLLSGYEVKDFAHTWSTHVYRFCSFWRWIFWLVRTGKSQVSV